MPGTEIHNVIVDVGGTQNKKYRTYLINSESVKATDLVMKRIHELGLKQCHIQASGYSEPLKTAMGGLLWLDEKMEQDLWYDKIFIHIRKTLLVFTMIESVKIYYDIPDDD